MASMRDTYGEKKGESVFYASRNAGKISGVDPASMPDHSNAHKGGVAHPDHKAHHGHMMEHLKAAGHGSHK